MTLIHFQHISVHQSFVEYIISTNYDVGMNKKTSVEFNVIFNEIT